MSEGVRYWIDASKWKETAAEWGIRVFTEEKLQMFGKSLSFFNYVHIWLGPQTYKMDMKNYYQDEILTKTSNNFWLFAGICLAFYLKIVD